MKIMKPINSVCAQMTNIKKNQRLFNEKGGLVKNKTCVLSRVSDPDPKPPIGSGVFAWIRF